MASATDQVTATAGKIGWWQIVLVLMASVPSFLFAWQILVGKYRFCKVAMTNVMLLLMMMLMMLLPFASCCC